MGCITNGPYMGYILTINDLHSASLTEPENLPATDPESFKQKKLFGEDAVPWRRAQPTLFGQRAAEVFP